MEKKRKKVEEEDEGRTWTYGCSTRLNSDNCVPRGRSCLREGSPLSGSLERK